MFFTPEDVALYAKRVRQTPRQVGEEMRGWRWPEPPLLPPSGRTLPVSDASGALCQTGRYVYLSYVKWVKAPTSPEAARGSLIHEAYAESVETVRKLIYSGEVVDGNALRSAMLDEYYEAERRLSEYSSVQDFHNVVKAIWDRATSVFGASLDRARERARGRRETLAAATIPFLVEFPIDGSLVGLSPNSRVDALIPNVPLVVEMKTGARRRAHERALAGYALAYESQYEVPVDFGLLCYVRVEDKVSDRCELLKIGEALRTEFLEERDRRLQVLEDGVDPGLPKFCDRECPFLSHCGGKVVQ
ncbi:type I-A CRISPR-associated protein Cas4/Csa1 [Sulfodiicoccus acidiphilus]|uniref:Type I-A CRISPR-associated protein Cas4/Csa1 n=1 Tax=Sulfodiicoccus acidiphilus TaxID=1670455 RepID=A0A348B575_9CREN|nr:type I-A CRISPR-associated protein Cas4/Csa1 [Sulfodiicoccus acidiphilus]BBD73327.1 type I-A CRISPR-associated protein Cas4/Csa1 [Sulfodiicoccus acidiphilus]GGT89079.1 type I-A CRISPR-associated protein Cas4/Csa1 [Sulfodiicoccus acidiphilus]